MRGLPNSVLLNWKSMVHGAYALLSHRHMWNWIDSAIILTWVISLASGSATLPVDPTLLRVARLARLLRTWAQQKSSAICSSAHVVNSSWNKFLDEDQKNFRKLDSRLWTFQLRPFASTSHISKPESQCDCRRNYPFKNSWARIG